MMSFSTLSFSSSSRTCLFPSAETSYSLFPCHRRLEFGKRKRNRYLCPSFSPSPLVGKRRWKQREVKEIVRSYGSTDEDKVVEEEENSSSMSENLSALLPFVVGATAVAALSRPSTFSW